jgi:hypothetical protein
MTLHVAFEKVFSHQGNIVAALAQRRNGQGKDP